MFKKLLLLSCSIFTASLLLTNDAVAMDDDDVDAGPSSAAGAHITGKGEVHVLDELSHPARTVLGLDGLEQRGLTGKDQVIGVVEFGRPLHTPPGLEGRILNEVEGGDNDEDKCSHTSIVSQVVASQESGIGFAPGAEIFLAMPCSKTDDIILMGVDDAIKWAIRKGAKAINLSISSKRTKDHYSRYFKRKTIEKGQATDDFTRGIRFALDKGVPVFLAAGNHKEDLLENPFLKSIWETWSNTHLLFIVGGYDYPNPVFRYSEIGFAERSAFSQDNDYTGASRHFVTGPFTVEAETFVSIEERQKRLQSFRFRFDAFALKDIWIGEFEETLARIDDQDLTSKISPLLLQFEESFVSFFADNEKCNNFGEVSGKLDNFRECLEGLVDKGKGTPLQTELERIEKRFLKLALAYLDDTYSIDSRERLKIPDPKGYNPLEVNGRFEEDILAIDPATGKPREEVFEIKTHKGTSFASPAVAAVYLRLHQFADQVNSEGPTLLTPDDIAACMKATAYRPATEEAEKFGCGVVHGGAALSLCERIVKARRSIGDFEEGLKIWERVFQALGQHLLPQYFLEVLKEFKLQDMFQRKESKEKAWDTCKRLLGYYPTIYDSHAADRLSAFALYLDGKYEESGKAVGKIFSDINENVIVGSLEWVLDNDPQISWVCGKFLPCFERLKLWCDSFLTCEKKGVKEFRREDGRTVFYESSSEPKKLSLDVREGQRLLDDLLQKTREGFDRLSTLDEWQQDIFLSDIEDLGETLEQIELPEDVVSEVKALSEKASQLKKGIKQHSN